VKIQRSNRRVWHEAVRVVIGGYFIWRGVYKLVTPPTVWLVPRVTAALSTTPLAPLIRRQIFPHAALFGLVLGTAESAGGFVLLALPAVWLAPTVLAALNGLFLLTLGFYEPHDLELNLLMGVLNAQMAVEAWRLRREAKAR
jgi:hypothetical protein